MAHELTGKTRSRFLIAVLVAILVSGGILAACGKTQTTTSAPGTTTSTTTTRTTTSTSALSTTTTSAPTGVSAADFYKANLVTIVVPSAPGGGTDYAARLIANYWTGVTGGRMIIENRSGANGLVGINYAYAAKPDGLILGEGMSDGMLVPVLEQNVNVKYDLKKMNWVGLTNAGESTGLAVGAKSPCDSMGDVVKVTRFKFASSGWSTTLAAALVVELFGIKDAKVVTGYGGSTEAMLAIGKGEADGYSISYAVILDGIGKGFLKKPILTVDFQRDTAYFPDVPAIPELLKLSPAQENLLKTFAALRGGQAFWFQPGVPQDRIDYVRNAFDKIAALEGFVKQSASRWKYVPFVSGRDYAAQMEKTLAITTPERFNELQKLVDRYTG